LSLPISTFLSLIVFFFFCYFLFILFFFFSHVIITFAVPQTISIVDFAALFIHGLDDDDGRREATTTMGVV
jgi:hypothetical protein